MKSFVSGKFYCRYLIRLWQSFLTLACRHVLKAQEFFIINKLVLSAIVSGVLSVSQSRLWSREDVARLTIPYLTSAESKVTFSCNVTCLTFPGNNGVWIMVFSGASCLATCHSPLQKTIPVITVVLCVCPHVSSFDQMIIILIKYKLH